MGVGRILIAALLALAGSVSAEAQQQKMRIQFAEPVNVPAGTGAVSFDAYGRRFNLELASNDRLTSKLPAQRKAAISAIKILRGTLSGQPGSWVRLTEYDGRVEGAIWDGTDLYVVTSHDRIAAHLTTPLAAPLTQTVVYRLSDTINFLPEGFCPDLPSPGLPANNGLAQYRSLVADLTRKVDAQSQRLLQIEISLIGDATFQALFSSNPTAELLARHNMADGIFTNQVGVMILPTDLRLTISSPDPFTATDAKALLDQLSDFRRDTPEVRAMGLAHLFTGRTLDGTTIGIAYRGVLCEVEAGVGLTEASFSATLDGLVMAHELGHNFGSPHDGVEACAGSPSGYIMWPEFNNSSQFSACSLSQMQPVIQAALGRCVSPANYPDVELPAPGPQIEVELDTPLTVPFVVNSTGTQTARNVQLKISSPFNFTNLPPSCAGSGTIAVCALGDIDAGDSRTIVVTVQPTSVGYNYFHAEVSADFNPNRHNDVQEQQLLVIMNADATVAMTASATDVVLGDPVDFSVDVSSIRTHAVQDVVLFFRPYLLRVDSASITGSTCDPPQQNEVRCTLGDLPAGARRTVVFHTTAVTLGQGQTVASVSARSESTTDNNTAAVNMRVRARHDVAVEGFNGQSHVSQFGQPFQILANVRSVGAQGIDNVVLEVNWTGQPNTQASVDSIMVRNVPCVVGAAANQCVVGNLAAGESVNVLVTGHADSAGDFYFYLRAISPDDQDMSNDVLGVRQTIRHAVDVEVSRTYSAALESEEASGSLELVSRGLNPANTDVVLTAPPEVRFTHFVTTPNLATCNIVDEQHLHCTMQLGASGSGVVGATFFMVSNVPGNYTLIAVATTPNDAEPANDTAFLTFNVNPILDVGVQPFTVPQTVRVGTEFTAQTTIFTGMRPVPSASAIIQTNAGAELSSVTVGTDACFRRSPTWYQCDLGSLPGNASIPVSMVVRAVAQNGTSNLRIAASATFDHDPSNGDRTVWFATQDPGDMSVSVGNGTASGTAGTAFNLPRIIVRRTGAWVGGRLEVSLPAGMTVNSMSTSIPTCTGTSLLQCDLPSWAAGTDLTLDLTVTAANAGTFTVNARVTATNDIDATNNEANMPVSIFAVAPPPSNPTPSQPTGGGGGGRFEWLALAILALLVTRRIPLRPLPTRH